MNRMDHKVCVIAGATQGLGAAGIVVTGRNEDRGAAVAEGIAATSRVPTLFVRGDLGSVEDCRRMIAEADKRFGRVNVLVNAGASTERGTILDTTPDLFDRMFAINVRGPYFLMQEAIKLMIRDSVEGAICNVGWMASDNERQLQAAESGDPDWMEKAASQLPFGRLIDPEEAARAVNFLVSDDAGLMTGAIVNFDQSVWGAVAGGMPAPDAPMKLVK